MCVSVLRVQVWFVSGHAESRLVQLGLAFGLGPRCAARHGGRHVAFKQQHSGGVLIHGAGPRSLAVSRACVWHS